MSLIAISKIVIGDNPRTIFGVEDFLGTSLDRFPKEFADGIKELATSIKLHGLANPITVKDLGGGKRFRLIAGARRLKACQYLGMTQIDSKSIKGKTADEPILALIENIHREALPAVDVARSLEKMRVNLGVKQAALAELVGKSQGWVSQYLSILRAHPDVVDAMEDGKVGLAAARNIASLPKDEQPAALKEAAKESEDAGAKKVTTRAARRSSTKRKKAKKDAQQTLRPLEERQIEQRAACIKDFLSVTWADGEKPPKDSTSIARLFWDYLMDHDRLVIRP